MSDIHNTTQNKNMTDVQKISAMIDDLENLLRTQRDMLRQRGMGLPPGTITHINNAQNELQNITARLSTEQVELNRLHALTDTFALVNSSMALDDVLNRVMDTVIQLTGAERGYIVLLEEETNDLVVRVARNLDQESIERGSFIVSRTVVTSVAETGQPIVTTNAQEDPRYSNQDSVVSYALRSILCVPLKVKDIVTGVVYADNRFLSGLFGESELELLYAFANQAAVAIENALLFERVSATLEEITENKLLLENVFASIASGVITTNHK
ncbi:GAF domain-containing protein, partial [Chloroflexota bacterium]